MEFVKRATSLFFVAMLAWMAEGLSRLPWFVNHGLGVLTLAMLLGIVVGNIFHRLLGTRCDWGIAFSRQRLLRVGVVLYGFRLTFQDVHHIGLAGVAADFVILGSTFVIATAAGVRLFGLDRTMAML